MKWLIKYRDVILVGFVSIVIIIVTINFMMGVFKNYKEEMIKSRPITSEPIWISPDKLTKAYRFSSGTTLCTVVIDRTRGNVALTCNY